jgi:hypothetical protein
MKFSQNITLRGLSKVMKEKNENLVSGGSMMPFNSGADIT